jgi:hypothetical protein
MKMQLTFICSFQVDVILLNNCLKQNQLPFSVNFLEVQMKSLESQHRTLPLPTALQ